MPTSIHYCNICNKDFHTRGEAQECEDRGYRKPRFKVEDAVYLKLDGSEDQFAERRVIRIEKQGHDTLFYELGSPKSLYDSTPPDKRHELWRSHYKVVREEKLFLLED